MGGPSFPNDCNQGGGQVSSGVGLFVGLGCGYATASVDAPDATVRGPQALGVGNMATASVDLAGVLNKVYSGGANQLCSALNQIPMLGTDVLGPACTQALSTVNPSLQVNVGNAYSEVISTTSEVEAISHSSSIDISVLPGIDSGADPLLRIQIPSATATSCEGTGCSAPNAACSTVSNGWTNSYDATLIEISGTLIDGVQKLIGTSFPDPIEVPPCGSGTSQLNQVAGPGQGPLCTNGLLCLTLASATTSGSGVSGSGLEVTVLPGQAPGGAPVIEANGAGIKTSNTAAGPAATLSAGGGSSTTTTIAAALAAGGGSSPTAVHTGEWWSGSMPLLVGFGLLGAGLVGWPRIRRFAFVSRFVSRIHR